jgi:hypothetical protein
MYPSPTLTAPIIPIARCVWCFVFRSDGFYTRRYGIRSDGFYTRRYGIRSGRGAFLPVRSDDTCRRAPCRGGAYRNDVLLRSEGYKTPSLRSKGAASILPKNGQHSYLRDDNWNDGVGATALAKASCSLPVKCHKSYAQHRSGCWAIYLFL